MKAPILATAAAAAAAVLVPAFWLAWQLAGSSARSTIQQAGRFEHPVGAPPQRSMPTVSSRIGQGEGGPFPTLNAPAITPLERLSRFELLRLITLDEDVATVAAAKDKFARSADEEAVRELASFYEAADMAAAQRKALADTVKLVANPPAVAGLRALLLEDHPIELAASAAEALAAQGTPEAVMALTEAYRQTSKPALREQLLASFLASEPVPESKGLLVTLAQEKLTNPWGAAADDLAARTPDPVQRPGEFAPLPQLAPPPKR